ncbi:MAG: hypothetical protein M3Y86_13080 [Verrucomicrobiota bacterium]|nr:hypothetical protein [Verrucomicrobiota bacterium]
MGVIQTPTPTPPRKFPLDEEEKPIPRELMIGGEIAAALALAGLAFGAQRAWRRSNLFGRQYRFPDAPETALRLGAEKCGGHLATIQFDAKPPRAAPRSEAKNT